LECPFWLTLPDRILITIVNEADSSDKHATPRGSRQVKVFIKKYGWLYLPGLLFLGLSSFLQTLLPKLLGQIIDSLNTLAGQEDMPAVGRSLLFLLLTAVGMFITRFAWRYFIMGNSRYLENCLRRELFDHLLILPVSYYQQQKTGDLMAYAINDIGAIRQTFGPGLALSASAIVLSILSIRSMTGEVNARLTFLALLPIPLILALVLLLGRQVQRRFRRVQEVFAAVSDRVQESISGIQVIKAHGQEQEEVARFGLLNQESRKANLRMSYISAATNPLVTLLFGVSFSIGLIYGSRLVLAGTISLGDFVAFNGYLALVVHPVQSVARIINMLQRGNASWKRFRKILGEVPAVRDTPDSLPAEQLPARSEGRLEIRDLTFSYAGQSRPALQHISLDLQPGRRIGILGRTGSGKTTLANLLVRLYDPPRGSLYLDGHDLLDLPLHWLREQIAFVPQDNFLFSASLEENIRFFNPAPSAEDVQQAARMADLHDTILEFPQGYQTVIGERGITLSGGQKQRVGLARALLKQAPLLVIDDTLSAVDTETEQRILTALHSALADQSCLIIANRVSALQNCDEILVLTEGCVTERGTHAQLLAAGGFYAAIATAQADSAGGEA